MILQKLTNNSIARFFSDKWNRRFVGTFGGTFAYLTYAHPQEMEYAKQLNLQDSSLKKYQTIEIPDTRYNFFNKAYVTYKVNDQIKTKTYYSIRPIEIYHNDKFMTHTFDADYINLNHSNLKSDHPDYDKDKNWINTTNCILDSPPVEFVGTMAAIIIPGILFVCCWY